MREKEKKKGLDRQKTDSVSPSHYGSVSHSRIALPAVYSLSLSHLSVFARETERTVPVDALEERVRFHLLNRVATETLLFNCQESKGDKVREGHLVACEEE